MTVQTLGLVFFSLFVSLVNIGVYGVIDQYLVDQRVSYWVGYVTLGLVVAVMIAGEILMALMMMS